MRLVTNFPPCRFIVKSTQNGPSFQCLSTPTSGRADLPEECRWSYSYTHPLRHISFRTGLIEMFACLHKTTWDSHWSVCFPIFSKWQRSYTFVVCSSWNRLCWNKRSQADLSASLAMGNSRTTLAGTAIPQSVTTWPLRLLALGQFLALLL